MRKKTKRRIAAGMGTAVALAAAAAAFYYFGGRKGAARKKEVKAWILKAKKEIVSRIKRLKKIDRREYEEAVNRVLGRYEKLKSVGAAEAAALKRELKGHWRKIKRQLGFSTKKLTKKKRH